MGYECYDMLKDLVCAKHFPQCLLPKARVSYRPVCKYLCDTVATVCGHTLLEGKLSSMCNDMVEEDKNCFQYEIEGYVFLPRAKMPVDMMPPMSFTFLTLWLALASVWVVNTYGEERREMRRGEKRETTRCVYAVCVLCAVCAVCAV